MGKVLIPGLMERYMLENGITIKESKVLIPGLMESNYITL